MSEKFETMRAVTLKAFGGVDVLQLSNVPAVTISRPCEVLIRVMAAGVNRADVLQRRGHYPPPKGCSELLGLEAAGVVERVGKSVTRFKEGDRVMTLLPGGGYAELVAVHEGSVMSIPQGFSFVEGAAVPEAFLTAWQVLKLYGNLEKGQKVLIHAGASGVGTAAAQLAEKYFGAMAIGTCSSEKLEFCKRYASIAVDRSLGEDGKCFATKVRKALGEDEGINLVIDPVAGGDYLNEDGDVLAQGGKIVVISYLGGTRADLNLATLFRKSATLMFTKLRSQTEEYKAALVSSFEKEIIPLMQDRKVGPVVQRTFPIEEVALAHSLVEDNKTHGKVILTLGNM